MCRISCALAAASMSRALRQNTFQAQSSQKGAMTRGTRQCRVRQHRNAISVLNPRLKQCHCLLSVPLGFDLQIPKKHILAYGAAKISDLDPITVEG